MRLMNINYLVGGDNRLFINLINIYSTIIKDNFAHIGGKLGELTNQRRETVAKEMIH